MSQGIRNFDATLSKFVKEDKKYLFGGQTKEEIAIEYDTSISPSEKGHRKSYLREQRLSLNCSVLVQSADERGFVFLIGNDWTCHEYGPKGKLFWKASFLPN